MFSDSRPKVLLVDDYQEVRQMLSIALENHGFQVLQALNGQEAVELYRRDNGSTPLVLMDVQMPGLDGPQTLEALQRINPAIRCCFMSGFPGRYNPSELLKRRGTAFLQKPFSLDELTGKLRQLLDAEPAE